MDASVCTYSQIVLFVCVHRVRKPIETANLSRDVRDGALESGTVYRCWQIVNKLNFTIYFPQWLIIKSYCSKILRFFLMFDHAQDANTVYMN